MDPRCDHPGRSCEMIETGECDFDGEPFVRCIVPSDARERASVELLERAMERSRLLRLLEGIR